MKKPRRRELTVIKDILKCCIRGNILTRIMRISNLDHKGATKYLNELIQGELIQPLTATHNEIDMLDPRSPKKECVCFRTTHDGKCFLQKLEKIKSV